jgi:hypothetical protein
MKRPEEKYLVDTQALTQNTLTALGLAQDVRFWRRATSLVPSERVLP